MGGQSISETDCIFCRIARGESPAHIVDEGPLTLTFLSLSNHPMVVPKAHVARLGDLDDATAAEMMVKARNIAARLRRATGCTGTNLALSDGRAAGQEVMHLHLHVLPRRSVGDDVRLTWNDDARSEETRRQLARALRD